MYKGSISGSVVLHPSGLDPQVVFHVSALHVRNDLTITTKIIFFFLLCFYSRVLPLLDLLFISKNFNSIFKMVTIFTPLNLNFLTNTSFETIF